MLPLVPVKPHVLCAALAHMRAPSSHGAWACFLSAAPLNILEAIGADLVLAVFGPSGSRRGHLANARAGLALVRNGPHSAGPAQFADTGDLIAINPRAVKAWADPYAAWNMCFVTLVGKWPYFLTKLVIPSVNDYVEDPGTYINRRALALEIHLYANGLGMLDGLAPSMDWTAPALTAVWGEVNREAARDYARQARAQ